MTSILSPLRAFRYCPKCGSHDISGDSGKLLKCPACGFEYYINMGAAVAAVIRNEKGEILFTIRKHEPSSGLLDLPGGFVDLGETAENAVIREVREELNLEISGLEFIATFTNRYIYKEIEYQTLDLAFSCQVVTFSQLKVADDVSGLVFRHPAEVRSEEIGLESIRKIIRSLYDN